MVKAEGACECECHDQRDTLDEMADFLAAIGYGYDFTSDVQTPEALRWPLAHAWYRKDNPGGGDPTPQDYYDQLADELGWGGRD